MELLFNVIFIIIFNLILYYRLINFDLVMDSYQWMKLRREKGFTSINTNIRTFIGERLYSGTTFGTNIKLEHAFTIFLHTCVCILMYFVFGHNEISFWAAILYSCNPINNQTSCWSNGRRYLINIILVLTMMLIPTSALILYPFSWLLQVTAFFSPVLLIKYSPWYLVLIPTMVFIGWKELKEKCDSRSSPISSGDHKVFKLTRLIVVVKTFGFFFWKMLLPQVCAMQYPDRIKWGLTKEGNDDAYRLDRSFLQGCTAIGFCGIVLWVVPTYYKPYVIFMFLAILQWSAVIPITQILSDRYCSLPNLFMMFFVSYLAHACGVMYVPLMVCLAVYYCICLSVVMPMYENIPKWYEYHFRYFPGLSWYRHNLIEDLMNEGKKDAALYHVTEGLYHDDKDFRLLVWGAIMAMIGENPEEADRILDKASQNFYLDKEGDQVKEIDHLRGEVKKLREMKKKFSGLTARERAIRFKRVKY